MKDEAGSLLPMEAGDVLYFTVKQNLYKPAPDLQKAVKEFPEGKAVVVLRPEDTAAAARDLPVRHPADQGGRLGQDAGGA